MNKLVLIGNGFDLAHGLETSYNHFVIWYLNKIIENMNKEMFYDDNNVSYKTSFRTNFERIKSVQEFLGIKDHELVKGHLKYKHPFFADLLDHSREFNWVDIEFIYYKNLVEVLNTRRFNTKEGYRDALLNLIDLNVSFESIKNKLIEYLKTIETVKISNERIERLFDEYIAKIDQGEHNSKLFLNFNYTSTIQNYWDMFKTPPGKEGKRDSTLINIHGSLDDESNPIIFGYGDEMDPQFDKLLELNEKDFLQNLKLYWYNTTDNYQRLKKFIDTEEFKVFIFGHSCGISDRSMLNRIFDHENCKAIQIFYHQRGNQNDFATKTQEISRHFSNDKRKKILDLILPFNLKDCMSRTKE